MKRKIALMAVSVLPALLLALSAMAPGAAAAPAAVASPSPRPSLTVPPTGNCLFRVFDNLEHLVIFRCENGALAFYRMQDGNGNFHSWLPYNGWALALPGKVALNNTNAAGYQVLFGRASTEDVEALNLNARTPPNKVGGWYHIILKAPGGAAVIDDYFFLDV